MSISTAAERAEACCYLNTAAIIVGLRAPTESAKRRFGVCQLSTIVVLHSSVVRQV